MNILLISIFLILLSGIFQGSFGLGMKRFSVAWEAYWLIFAITGMILIPLVCVWITIPDPLKAISSLSLLQLTKTLLFGLFWGITALMFGISIKYLGVSLAYGIAMGISAAVGSLVPLFQIENFMSHASTLYILIGNSVLICGVIIITRAGQLRERMQSAEFRENALLKGGKFFRLGLMLAILSGIGAAMLNIGFVSADPAVKAAMEQGVKPQNASLIAWTIVLSGGFIASLIYCIYLFIKNKTVAVVRKEGNINHIIKWSLLTAVLWFAALGLYGQGAAMMGEMGPVAGWAMFSAISLVVSNLWGIRSGEWLGVKKPMKVLIAGDVILLLSWIIMGYANSLI